MALDFLSALNPPLDAATLAALRDPLLRGNVSLSTLAQLGMDGLKELIPAIDSGGRCERPMLSEYSV